MKKKRHNTEQIMRILGESEGSWSAFDVCREHQISEQPLDRWKRKYAVMDVHDTKRLKGLEEENRRLKKLVAKGTCTILTGPSAGGFPRLLKSLIVRGFAKRHLDSEHSPVG